MWNSQQTSRQTVKWRESGEREGGACSKWTQIRLETRPVLFNKTKVNTTLKKINRYRKS